MNQKPKVSTMAYFNRRHFSKYGSHEDTKPTDSRASNWKEEVERQTDPAHSTRDGNPEAPTSTTNSAGHIHPEIPRLDLSKVRTEALQTSGCTPCTSEQTIRHISDEAGYSIRERQNDRSSCGQSDPGEQLLTSRTNSFGQDAETKSMTASFRESDELSGRMSIFDQGARRISSRTSSDAEEIEEFERSMEQVDLSDF
eukprot:gb/GECG01008043.1/.p1 GENE.gb/GECG01008043.1/~~gb/GECG01008043.1/.p1  ORF type:complete len:198 (+),score=21.48 gb/GECG01008043.1/:1-594(+)